MGCISLWPGACDRAREQRGDDVAERMARAGKYHAEQKAAEQDRRAREQAWRTEGSLTSTQNHQRETEVKLNEISAKYSQLLKGSQVDQQKASAQIKTLGKKLNKVERLASRYEKIASQLQEQKTQIGKCLSSYVGSNTQAVRCIAGVLAGTPPAFASNLNKTPASTSGTGIEGQQMPVDASPTATN